MTLRQFRLMVEGARTREMRQREAMAWQIAWQIAPHLKHAKKPDEILGRPTVDQIRSVKRDRRRRRMATD